MHLDATFYALVALVLFLGIVLYMGVPKTLGKALDDRSAQIAKDLDDAKRLREEAQALLNEYKQKRVDAEKEAQGIVDQAKRDAEALAVEGKAKLADMLTRRTKQAEQKIAQAQAAAVKDVRNLATESAVAAATKLIAGASSGAKGAGLIAESIAAVKSRLN